MTPWTYDEFDAHVDEHREALSRRDRSLVVRLALTIGSIFLALSVVPHPGKAGGDRWLLALVVGVTAFVAYVLATSRSYSRRHAVRCPACGAPLTAVADWLADARNLGLELPSHVDCPQCKAVVIAPAT